MYDSFFKHVLNSEVCPKRLSLFLSSVLKKKMKIISVLPNDATRIMDGGSFIIMDILVQLEDDSLANIEVQKILYNFPGERIDCYGADLLIRQYTREKNERKKDFTYKDLKTVYTIVIMENSTSLFHQFPNNAIHKGGIIYDTGLPLKHLHQNVIIALDLFKKNTQTIITELDAWLYFLSSDDPAKIWEIQQKSPYFRELYADIAEFRKDISEVLNMYSKTLSILDRNTAMLMVAYSAKTAHPFQRNGALFRLKLSGAQLID